MGHNWILDVLTDLKTYARQNDLPVLAEHLGDAGLVAAAEITSLDGMSTASMGAHGDRIGKLLGEAGAGDIA